ncbi:MAG TPA: F0F1 ATP synthase subunit C [Candidatus Saccharimonadales bacterium]|nr:F0F1 ATP synthase subunit C [Candidatus Saccharimonadales bacterium]
MVQLLAAEAAKAEPLFGKGFMLAFAFAAAAMGLGMLGANYMKALGRNPEAGKAATQLIIIAAMIEVTALLAFLMGAFLLK